MSELFEYPPTRSNRAKWALEELEINYISRVVDFTNNEQSSGGHLDLHPLGHVPVYRTNTYSMHESVAIVLQLLDDHPDAMLAPQIGDPKRAAYLQWCVFAASELDHNLFYYMQHTMHLPEEKRVVEISSLAKNNFNARAEALSSTLKSNNYLLGGEFSGADVCVGYSCNWAAYTGLLDDHPILVDYYQRLEGRPAFEKVFNP